MLENLKCKPGNYLEIIPIGLQCTLQYNSNGILQKIILGFNAVDFNERGVECLDSDLTLRLMKANKFPHRIPFTMGTTWVKSVFYTKKKFKSTGSLPHCQDRELIEDMTINIGDYKLYACDLINDSFNFLGGPTISTRLATFGFEPIPGYQIFDNVSSLPLAKIMNDKKSPFEYPYIAGIMTYDTGKHAEYVPAGLTQSIVNTAEDYIEEHGYLRSRLVTNTGIIDVPYSDTVQYNLGSKTTIVLNGKSVVASRRPNGLLNNKISRDKECSICHGKMIVPPSGHTCCSNIHCPSRQYLYINHFLKVLGLQTFTFEEYLRLVDSKAITCLLDVFYLEGIEGVEVNCTLSNLLFAAVPFEVCRGLDFFQQFTNYLGSVEAFDFYLEDPDAIVKDLHLNKMFARNFADWLKDPENLLMIRSLLDMKDIIHIEPVRKSFEGDPIFRGKTICLTGKFRRGTLEDVIGILQSYSARVVTNFDNTVNCVVIGHFEGEDTMLTEIATSYNIPIYGEDDFFTSYEIDKDLQGQHE